MGEGRRGFRPLLPRTSPSSPPKKVKRSEWRMGGLDKVPSPGAHHPCSPPPPLPHPAYREWTEKSAPQLSTLLGRAKKKRWLGVLRRGTPGPLPPRPPRDFWSGVEKSSLLPLTFLYVSVPPWASPPLRQPNSTVADPEAQLRPPPPSLPGDKRRGEEGRGVGG